MFLLFLCVLYTRIESSLSRVVLFGLSCVRSVFYVLGGVVELEPRKYNCGLRYLTVSCRHSASEREVEIYLLIIAATSLQAGPHKIISIGIASTGKFVMTCTEHSFTVWTLKGVSELSPLPPPPSPLSPFVCLPQLLPTHSVSDRCCDSMQNQIV